jgi:formate-dependent nitrite reductase membrane component NrfD
MWAIGLFGLAAGVVLLGPRWTADGASGIVVAAEGLSLVAACVILLYEGFVYAASKAIPFWRTRLLPALYIAYGLRGGAALLLTAAAFGGNGFDVEAVEAIKTWVVASTGVLILLYLVAGSRAGSAARASVAQLIAGRISPAFYGGTVAVGILVPLGLALTRDAFGIPELIVLGTIGLASLVGDFYVKYCVVKAGVYVPLMGAREV